MSDKSPGSNGKKGNGVDKEASRVIEIDFKRNKKAADAKNKAKKNGAETNQTDEGDWRKLISIAVLIAIVAAMVYALLGDDGSSPPLISSQAPQITSEAGSVAVRIQGNQSDQYIVKGTLNDKPMNFIVDTGASVVTVPFKYAQYFDLPIGEAYESITANGTVRSYTSTAKSINIGGLVVNDVQAGLATGLDQDIVLLGMSFLRHFDFKRDGEVFVIRKESM